MIPSIEEYLGDKLSIKVGTWSLAPVLGSQSLDGVETWTMNGPFTDARKREIWDPISFSFYSAVFSSLASLFVVQ